MKIFKVIEGKKAIDDRGSVSFINSFDPEQYGIKRFYIVENHKKGFIRAWHGHRKETKYALVLQGTAILAAVNLMEVFDNYTLEPENEKIILDGSQPKIVQIPAGYFNGFKLLTEGAKIMFFSTNTIEEASDDDIRISLNELLPNIFNIEER